MPEIKLKQFAGLNNQLPPEELTSQYFIECQNIDITDTGTLRSRDGYTAIIDGSIHSLWSNGDICLFRQLDTLKRFNTDNTTTVLLTGLSWLSIKMNYLTLNDKIYFTDGISSGIYENGLIRTWGLTIPVTPYCRIIPGVLSNLTTGQYQITYIYIRDDGQISGSPSASVVNITSINQAIEISITASDDPTVDSIAIYSTAVNGEMFYLIYSLKNIDQIVIIDTVNAIGTGLISNSFILSPPPKGQLIEYYLGRIYIAQDNILHFTEAFGYELYSPYNFIQFETALTMLSAIDNGLFISTVNNIYFLSGTKPEEFQKITIANYGAIEGSTIRIDANKIGLEVQGQVIVFAAQQGVCIGGHSGLFSNITNKNYQYPTTLNNLSAGLLKEVKGLIQYVFSLQDLGSEYNKYKTIT